VGGRATSTEMSAGPIRTVGRGEISEEQRHQEGDKTISHSRDPAYWNRGSKEGGRENQGNVFRVGFLRIRMLSKVTGLSAGNKKLRSEEKLAVLTRRKEGDTGEGIGGTAG